MEKSLRFRLELFTMKYHGQKIYQLVYVFAEKLLNSKKRQDMNIEHLSPLGRHQNLVRQSLSFAKFTPVGCLCFSGEEATMNTMILALD